MDSQHSVVNTQMRIDSATGAACTKDEFFEKYGNYMEWHKAASALSTDGDIDSISLSTLKEDNTLKTPAKQVITSRNARGEWAQLEPTVDKFQLSRQVSEVSRRSETGYSTDSHLSAHATTSSTSVITRRDILVPYEGGDRYVLAMVKRPNKLKTLKDSVYNATFHQASAKRQNGIVISVYEPSTGTEEEIFIATWEAKILLRQNGFKNSQHENVEKRASHLLSLLKFREISQGGTLSLQGLDSLRENRTINSIVANSDVSDYDSWGITAEEEAAVKVQAFYRGRMVRNRTYLINDRNSTTSNRQNSNSTKNTKNIARGTSLTVIENPKEIDLLYRPGKNGHGAIVMSLQSAQSEAVKAGVRVGWCLSSINDVNVEQLPIRKILKNLHNSKRLPQIKLVFHEMVGSEIEDFLKYAGSDAMLCDTTEAVIKIQANARGQRQRRLFHNKKMLITLPYYATPGRPQYICGIIIGPNFRGIGAIVVSLDDIKSKAVSLGICGGWILSKIDDTLVENLSYANIMKRIAKAPSNVKNVGFRPLKKNTFEYRMAIKNTNPNDDNKYGINSSIHLRTPKEKNAILLQKLIRGYRSRQSNTRALKPMKPITLIGGNMRVSLGRLNNIPQQTRSRKRTHVMCVYATIGEYGREWSHTLRKAKAMDSTSRAENVSSITSGGDIKSSSILYTSEKFGVTTSIFIDQTHWFQLDSFSNPELVILVMLLSKNGQEEMICKSCMQIPTKRSSFDQIQMPLFTPTNGNGGQVELFWERNIVASDMKTIEDIVRHYSGKQQKSRLKFITVKCLPGDHGGHFMNGPSDIGLYIRSFTLVDGLLGPLESNGVQLGMHLRRIDNNFNISELDSNHILDILKNKSNSTRNLTFSSHVSKAAIQQITLRLFATKRQLYATRVIQNCMRRWSERGHFGSIPPPKTMLGHDLNLSLLSASKLTPRLRRRENRKTRVIAALGESGQTWNMKVLCAKQRGLLSKQLTRSSAMEKNTELVWDRSLWMRLDGLKIPEITLRVVDEEPIEAGVDVKTKTTIIGECLICITPGLRYLAPREIPMLSFLPDELEDWTANVIVGWERSMSVNLDKGVGQLMHLPRKRVITAKCPPGPLGCTIGRCVGGRGARIASFVLINGKPGPLESYGVQLGMYLLSNNKILIGDMDFTDVMEVMKKTKKKTRLLTFGTRPTEKSLKLAITEAFDIKNEKYKEERAVRVIQRQLKLHIKQLRHRKSLKIVESMKSTDNVAETKDFTSKIQKKKTILGTLVDFVVENAHGLVLPPKENKVLLTRARVNVIVGETGTTWISKYNMAIASKSLKRRLKRSRDGDQINSNPINILGKSSKVSRNLTWSSQKILLDTNGIINPEATVRIVCIKEKDDKKSKIVIGETVVQLPNSVRGNDSAAKSFVLLSQHQKQKSGLVKIHWERVMGQAQKSRIKSVVNRKKVKVVCEPGPIGAAFAPGFGGVGVRLVYFKLVDGRPGPLEKSDIDDTDVGDAMYDDVILILKVKQKLTRCLTFSNRPSEAAIKVEVLKILKGNRRKNACKILQKSVRKWLAQQHSKEYSHDVSLGGRDNRTHIPMVLGSDIKITALKSVEISSPKRSTKGKIFIRVRSGEIGETWETKYKRLGTKQNTHIRDSPMYTHEASWSTRPKASNQIWGTSKWITINSLVNPEITFCIIERGVEDVFDNVSEKILCHGVLEVANTRTSNGIVSIPMATLAGKMAGSLLISWERPLIQGDKKITLEELGRIRRRTIVVKVNPGSLFCEMEQGFGGIGAKIASFTLNSNGMPGPLESQGVEAGMYITSIKCDPTLSKENSFMLISGNSLDELPFSDIKRIVSSSAKQRRIFTFSSRPTDIALKNAISVISLGNSQTNAATIIQNVIRRRQAYKMFKRAFASREQTMLNKTRSDNLVDAIITKVESGNQMKQSKTTSIHMTINEVTNLDGPNNVDDRMTFVRFVAGEEGEPWEQKMARATKGFTTPLPCSKAVETSKILKSWSPSWPNETAKLSLSRLRRPEVSLRVYDIDTDGNEITKCEATVRVANARSSGGSIDIRWRGVGDINWTGEVKVSWQRIVGLHVSSPKKKTLASLSKFAPIRKIQVTVPPGPLGCRLDPGFAGLGVMVTQFLLLEGRPGKLEVEGVLPGMYMLKVNGDTEISSMEFPDVLKILKDSTQIVRTFLFSTRPSKRAMQLGTLKFLQEKREDAASNLIKRVLRKRLARMRADDLLSGRVSLLSSMIGGDFMLSIKKATGIVIPKFKKGERKSESLVLRAVIGEKDNRWQSKIESASELRNNEQSISQYSRVGVLPGIKWSKKPVWNQGLINLNMANIKIPELTIQLVDVRHVKSGYVICEATMDIPDKRSSDGTIQVPLISSQMNTVGLIFFEWERNVTIDGITNLVIRKSHQPRERTLTLKVDPGTLGVRFQPGFMGLGARLASFVLVNGKPGPLERQGCSLGSYLTYMTGTDETGDFEANVGNMKFSELSKFLQRYTEFHRKLTFCTRPTELVMKLATLEAFALGRQNRAISTLQRIFREKKALKDNFTRYNRMKRYKSFDDYERSIRNASQKLATSVRVLIMNIKGLPNTKRRKGSDVVTFVLGAVGERGQNWNKKMSLSKVANNTPGRGSLSCVSKKIPKSDILEFVESHWLKVGSLLNPELTMRVIDEVVNKKTNKTEQRMLAEFSCLLPKERSSGEKPLIIPMQSLLPLMELGDNQAKVTLVWERAVEGNVDTLCTDGEKHIKKNVKVSITSSEAPLGIQLQRGFGGVGVRISGFVLADGSPGQLEADGVEVGMYLNSINGNDVSVENFRSVLKILRGLKASLHKVWPYVLELNFSSHPTDRAMQVATLEAMGLDQGAAKAAKIIQRFIRNTLLVYINNIYINNFDEDFDEKQKDENNDTTNANRYTVNKSREEITVTVNPGSLGLAVVPYSDGQGVIVKRLRQIYKNKGVRPGMFLAKIDNHDLSKMKWKNILNLITKTSGKSRKITFQTLNLVELRRLAVTAFSRRRNPTVIIQRWWRKCCFHLLEANAATKLQAHQRGKVQRRKTIQKHKAATKLQAYQRGKVQRHKTAQKHEVATKLQAHQRGKVQRRKTIQKHKAATKLQAYQRGKIQRLKTTQKHKAATKLQAHQRGKVQRRKTMQKHKAATKLQAHQRGKAHRHCVKVKIKAATKIQAQLRGKAVRSQNLLVQAPLNDWVVVKHPYIAVEDDEITLIKGMVLRVLYRGNDGWWEGETPDRRQRGVFPGNYTCTRKEHAATRIQARSRGGIVRSKKSRQFAAASTIQAAHRGYSVRRTLVNKKLDTTNLRGTDIVVAKFPYEAQDIDEISLVRGMVLRVFDRGVDGWWNGKECNSEKSGVFPGNYCCLQTEWAAMIIQSAYRASIYRNSTQTSDNETNGIIDDNYVLVTHDYVAQDDDELTLVTGMELRVVQRQDDGWWEGETPVGQYGWFPENFTRPYDRRIAAATKIQARARAHTTRRYHTGNRKAATVVQARFRGWKARREMILVKKINNAGIQIQTSNCDRSVPFVKGKVSQYDTNAAIKIQASYRGVAGRRRALGARERYSMATRIQARQRGRMVRKEMVLMGPIMEEEANFEKKSNNADIKPVESYMLDGQSPLNERRRQHRLAKLGQESTEADGLTDDDVVALMAGMDVDVAYGSQFQAAFPDVPYKFSGVIVFVSTAELVIDFGPEAGGEMVFVPDKAKGKLVDPDGWDVKIIPRDEEGRLAVSRRRFMGTYFGDKSRPMSIREDEPLDDESMKGPFISPTSRRKTPISRIISRQPMMMNGKQMILELRQAGFDGDVRVSIVEAMKTAGGSITAKDSKSKPLLTMNTSDLAKQALLQQQERQEHFDDASDSSFRLDQSARSLIWSRDGGLVSETETLNEGAAAKFSTKSDHFVYNVLLKRGSLGVTLQEEGEGRVVVGEVIEGEMAQKQGVKVGDCIVSIGNDDVRDFGYDGIISKLQNTKRPFGVQFLRQNKNEKASPFDTRVTHDNDESKSNAIVKIQAIQRGRYVRSRKRDIRWRAELKRANPHVTPRGFHVVQSSEMSKYDDLMYEQASSKVQAIFRGRRDRIIFSRKRSEETSAAVKIQAMQRSKFVRSISSDKRWRLELKGSNPHVTPRGIHVTQNLSPRDNENDTEGTFDVSGNDIFFDNKDDEDGIEWQDAGKSTNDITRNIDNKVNSAVRTIQSVHRGNMARSRHASRLRYAREEKAAPMITSVVKGRKSSLTYTSERKTGWRSRPPVEAARFLRFELQKKARTRGLLWNTKNLLRSDRVTKRSMRQVLSSMGIHTSDKILSELMQSLGKTNRIWETTWHGLQRVLFNEFGWKGDRTSPRTRAIDREKATKDIKSHVERMENARKEKAEKAAILAGIIKAPQLSRDTSVAATKIQAIQRGRSSRRKTILSDQKQNRNSSAVKIQALQRGYSSRRKEKIHTYNIDHIQNDFMDKALAKSDTIEGVDYSSDDTLSIGAAGGFEGVKHFHSNAHTSLHTGPVIGPPRNLAKREVERLEKQKSDRIQRDEEWKQFQKRIGMKRRRDQERRQREREHKEALAQAKSDSPIPGFVNRLYGEDQQQKAREARVNLMIKQKDRIRRKNNEKQGIPSLPSIGLNHFGTQQVLVKKRKHSPIQRNKSAMSKKQKHPGHRRNPKMSPDKQLKHQLSRWKTEQELIKAKEIGQKKKQHVEKMRRRRLKDLAGGTPAFDINNASGILSKSKQLMSGSRAYISEIGSAEYTNILDELGFSKDEVEGFKASGVKTFELPNTLLYRGKKNKRRKIGRNNMNGSKNHRKIRKEEKLRKSSSRLIETKHGSSTRESRIRHRDKLGRKMLLRVIRIALKKGMILNGHKINSISDFFLAIDTDNTGLISSDQLQVALRRIQAQLTNEQRSKIINGMPKSTQNTKEVNWHDFIVWKNEQNEVSNQSISHPEKKESGSTSVKRYNTKALPFGTPSVDEQIHEEYRTSNFSPPGFQQESELNRIVGSMKSSTDYDNNIETKTIPKSTFQNTSKSFKHKMKKSKRVKELKHILKELEDENAKLKNNMNTKIE